MRTRRLASRPRSTRVVSPLLRASIALAAIAGALLAPAHAGAQVAQAAKTQGKTLKWGAAPPVFAPGAQMAVVSGNPNASGHYVVQLAMPAGYKVAPHFHPTDEHVRVVRGTFLVGMGDHMNASTMPKMKRLAVGDTITAPANMHHYAEAEGRTVVEVSGMGPFKLTYVKPSDMPKAMAKMQMKP